LHLNLKKNYLLYIIFKSYFITTDAPASSKSFLISSAFSLEMPSLIALGTDSIKSLASFSPKDVIVRRALITVIRLAVGTSCIITSNSVFSSTIGSSILLLVGKLITELLLMAVLAFTSKVCSVK